MNKIHWWGHGNVLESRVEPMMKKDEEEFLLKMLRASLETAITDYKDGAGLDHLTRAIVQVAEMLHGARSDIPVDIATAMLAKVDSQLKRVITGKPKKYYGDPKHICYR